MTRRPRGGRDSSVHGLRLAERARRTERVIERYRAKPFAWQGANCIRLARAQARAMGHQVPPVPLFRSALGARRALKAEGFDTVAAMLDAYFPRLPAPAFMLVGDLCVMADDDDGSGIEPICVADGQGNLFGWHGEDPSRLWAIKFAMADVACAWRL